MAIAKLNYKSNGHIIIDELFTLDATKKYTLAHGNVLLNMGIEVWTGPLKTGTKITDYIVSTNPTKFWLTDLSFGTNVLLTNYYISYYSQGDEIDADTINSIETSIENIAKSPIASLVIQPTTYFTTNNITVDTATNLITIPNHGLVQGDKVSFVTLKDMPQNSVPLGVLASRTHFVRQVSGNSFKVATDNTDSTLITFTGAGNADKWMLEKQSGVKQIDLDNINHKAVRVVIKNGAISNLGALNIKVNGVGDTDTYQYWHNSASGISGLGYIFFSNNQYITNPNYMIDIVSSNNIVNAWGSFSAVIHGTNGLVARNQMSFGSVVSKIDSRFDTIRSLSLNFSTDSLLGNLTVEVYKI